jgi:hypothetical protein
MSFCPKTPKLSIKIPKIRSLRTLDGHELCTTLIEVKFEANL